MIDTALSFVAVCFLAPYLSKGCRKLGLEVPKAAWLYLTIPLSVLAHWIVGTLTPLTRNFLDPQGHIIVKIVILVLLVLGLKDIRLIKNK